MPLRKAFIGVALLVIGREGRADGGESGPLHIARQIKVRARHFRFGQRHIDVIMRVDPVRLRHDLVNPRIGCILRPAVAQAQNHGRACNRRVGEKLPSGAVEHWRSLLH